MAQLDIAELVRDLAMNLAALSILVFAGYYRRHRRWDQVIGYVAFNISLFTVAAALGTSAPLNIGVGFGLFAVLSIVRLRSNESGQVEIGYTMVSLVLGLMSGLSGMDFGVKCTFAAILVGVMLLIDAGGGHHPSRRWVTTRIELDRVITDDTALVAHISERLGAAVRDVHVRDIDFARDTMRLEVTVARRQPDSTTPP